MSSRIAVLLLALSLSGCVSIEMGRLAREVEQEVERDGSAEIGRGFAVAFGGGTIGTSRFLGRLVAPESTEPYRRLSASVRQGKGARYPLVGTIDGMRMARPSRLDAYEADGWLPMVSARDSASATWVLYREDAEGLRLTDLLAVVVSDEELVLTRITGDLTTLALDAFRESMGDSILRDALDDSGVLPTEVEPDDGPPVDAGP